MADGIAVFDLDGTLTSTDTYKRFLRARLRAKPWRLLRCLSLPVYRLVAIRQKRDHVWLKLKALRAVAAGSSRPELERFARRFAQQVIDTDIPAAARERLEDHKASGDTLVLCSASFDFYVEAIGELLGVDAVICTRAVWANDRLRAEIDGENCYGKEKVRRLDAFVAERITRSDSIITAYTDHHSDLPLLEWADRPVAISPTRALLKLVKERGITAEFWHAQSAR